MSETTEVSYSPASYCLAIVEALNAWHGGDNWQDESDTRDLDIADMDLAIRAAAHGRFNLEDIWIKDVEIDRLREDCAQLYQVIGHLATKAGVFESDLVEKALDNANAAAGGDPRPHEDLIPFILAPKRPEPVEDPKPKLCKDCKWIERGWFGRVAGKGTISGPMCRHPEFRLTGSPDLVLGGDKFKRSDYSSAEYVRSMPFKCGPDARMWEKK